VIERQSYRDQALVIAAEMAAAPTVDDVLESLRTS
jgi:hypothetical protein